MSNHAPWRKQRLGSRPPIVPNQTYSVQEAAAALGVAPISVWRYIYSGRLRRCLLGRRTVITGRQLLDLLAASESDF
jgi:hypothetical protein